MTNSKLHHTMNSLVSQYGVVAIIKSLIVDVAARHLRWTDHDHEDQLSQTIAARFLLQRRLLEACLQILMEAKRRGPLMKVSTSWPWSVHRKCLVDIKAHQRRPEEP